MRVMCINKQNRWVSIKWKQKVTSYFFGLKKVTTEVRHEDPENGPKYGDICTVTGENIVEGKKYYYLLEWSDNNDTYIASQFMPIEEVEDEVPAEKEKLTS